MELNFYQLVKQLLLINFVAVYRGDPSGWGYNPAAPYATMPQYGGYNGLKRYKQI